MDTPFSLYIDHQKIAPLVRLLENAVETCREDLEDDYEAHQIRMTLYQEFLSTLHSLYLSMHPEIKFENGQMKVQDSACPLPLPSHNPHIEGLSTIINAPTLPKKQRYVKHRTRGLSARSLQVELQLVQWIQSCEKRIFTKKEIDLQYQELWGDEKKTISLKAIKGLVEKFNLPALIVKTRNKEEHFFGVELNASTSTLPKEEENSLNQSVWLDDDNDTVRDYKLSLPEEIKEESCSEMSSIDIEERLVLEQVMAEQQSVN